MTAPEQISQKTVRAPQREYWAGWDDHKAGRVRPDATRPFAQQGWDAWSSWLVKKRGVSRDKLLERLRFGMPGASVEAVIDDERGVKVAKGVD